MREPEYFTCAVCGMEFRSAKNAASHICKKGDVVTIPNPPKSTAG